MTQDWIRENWESIVEGMKAVRASGRINMLDKRGVADVAWELGYMEAAVWAFKVSGPLYLKALYEIDWEQNLKDQGEIS